jgi:hypothetical protein
MVIAERTSFQPAFSRKEYRFDESVKKVFAMSLPSLLDDFEKSSRRLF